jgi:hypothetical protein
LVRFCAGPTGGARARVEVPLEGIESAAPEFAVRREPGIDLGEGFGTQAVAAALGGHPHGDESRFTEHSQMLRNRRLAEVHLLHEVADGPFAVAQKVEDGASPGFREHVESLHHSANVLRRAYSCQGMLFKD